MIKFLKSKSLKLSVLFAVAGFLFATLVMWVAVAIGVAPIQLPLPSTVVSVGILLLTFWGMMGWLGFDVTRETFKDDPPSWGAVFMVPLFWIWILLSGGILTALYIGMVHFFFSVLWLL